MTSIWPSAVVVVGAGIDHLDIAEFLGGFLRALVGGFKEADAERLDNQRNLLVFRMRGVSHQCQRNRCRDHQCLQNFHDVLLPEAARSQ